MYRQDNGSRERSIALWNRTNIEEMVSMIIPASHFNSLSQIRLSIKCLNDEAGVGDLEKVRQ